MAGACGKEDEKDLGKELSYVGFEMATIERMIPGDQKCLDKQYVNHGCLMVFLYLADCVLESFTACFCIVFVKVLEHLG